MCVSLSLSLSVSLSLAVLQVANSGYSSGFVALTVAPDRKSVVINWQLTANMAGVQMRSAGIYGPATKDQVWATLRCCAKHCCFLSRDVLTSGIMQEKPMNAGVLLDMGIITPANGQTGILRKKVQSDQMEQILTFMREGRAYVNVMTETHRKGAMRGQLVVPKCMDGSLLPTKNTTEHYGFANIMVSPDEDDKSVAVLIQVGAHDFSVVP